MLNFEEATDRLTKCVTLADLARELGVTVNTVTRARMEGANARTPPARWEKAIARLARSRSRALTELATRMEHAEMERIFGAIFQRLKDREWHTSEDIADHLLRSRVLPRELAIETFQRSKPAVRNKPENWDPARQASVGAELLVKQIIEKFEEKLERVESVTTPGSKRKYRRLP